MTNLTGNGADKYQSEDEGEFLYYARPSWRFWGKYLVHLMSLTTVYVVLLVGLGCYLYCVTEKILVDEVSSNSQLMAKFSVFAESLANGGWRLFGLEFTVICMGMLVLMMLWCTLRTVIYSIVTASIRYKVADEYCAIENNVLKFLSRKFERGQLIGWSTEQSWLDRMLDCGAVTWYLPNKRYRWVRVGHFRDFCSRVLDSNERGMNGDEESLLGEKVSEVVYCSRPLVEMAIGMLIRLAVLVLLWIVAMPLGASSLQGHRMLFMLFTVWALGSVWSRIKRTLGTRYSIVKGVCESSCYFGRNTKQCFRLDRVKILKMKQSLLGRLLNYGTVVWELSGNKVRWSVVPGFKELRASILDILR